MQALFNLLAPSDVNWESFAETSAIMPFDGRIVDFLSDLSISLLKDKTSRLYADVVSFAYFCRKANIINIKNSYYSKEKIRLGRGLVFHIAPSNVPMNFAYSMAAGMLAGNLNVVKVPSKDFPQVRLVLKHINSLIVHHIDVMRRLAIVRYDRLSEATAFFSAMASVRIIWGGDATIYDVRKNALPPRSFDLCFADRYSIAVINPDSVMKADEKEMRILANGFYNDTYLYDQNACTAPHIVFWKKSPDVNMTKEKFWRYVHGVVESKYDFQPKLAVDKLTAFYSQAVDMPIYEANMPDNLIVRAELENIPKNITDYRCIGGYFNEIIIDGLEDILPILTDRYQTLAYYGIDKDDIRRFVLDHQPKGIDRYVPIGKTTDFSLIWDGYNLINTLSREVSICD